MNIVTAPGTGNWQSTPDVRRGQQRTVRTLVVTQIVGGVGVGAAASLGALFAQAVAHSEMYAGIARTSSTLGAAVFGLPLAALAARRGRRHALSLGWLIAAVGGATLVAAAIAKSMTLLIVGMLLFGCGNATNLQSRYAATDLATPATRARALSVVVWSTTVGAVIGPNLAGPGASVASLLGTPRLSGAFVISAGCLFVAAVVLWVRLRPDPLLTARALDHVETDDDRRHVPKLRLRQVLREIAALPSARFAFVAVVLGNTIMAAVMTMTPVDMADHGASLTIVGLTISAHVLGMFAFSPVVGWLADRFGRVRVVVLGQVIFWVSSALSGLSHGSVALVTAGLFLLGLGWSFTVVAGSALLSESVSADIRPLAQGATDTSMNLVAAVAAGIAGPAMTSIGFGGLNTLAAVLVVPTLVLLLVPRRRSRSDAAVTDKRALPGRPGVDRTPAES